jgi:hypothetical protein
MIGMDRKHDNTLLLTLMQTAMCILQRPISVKKYWIDGAEGKLNISY